jgi:hypothetical protein
MMVRLRSKTTQITATISPFRADPGGTQIPIVILSTRIQIFLHFGSINGLSLSVYLRTNLDSVGEVSSERNQEKQL